MSLKSTQANFACFFIIVSFPIELLDLKISPSSSRQVPAPWRPFDHFHFNPFSGYLGLIWHVFPFSFQASASTVATQLLDSLQEEKSTEAKSQVKPECWVGSFAVSLFTYSERAMLSSVGMRMRVNQMACNSKSHRKRTWTKSKAWGFPSWRGYPAGQLDIPIFDLWTISSHNK